MSDIRTDYNKLVRDNIPGIIEKTGGRCKVRQLDNDEYRSELKNKLKEEVQEYLDSTPDDRLEELADILEVIYALSEIDGFTREQLENMQLSKKESRGAFKDKLFLIYTIYSK